MNEPILQPEIADFFMKNDLLLWARRFHDILLKFDFFLFVLFYFSFQLIKLRFNAITSIDSHLFSVLPKKALFYTH